MIDTTTIIDERLEDDEKNVRKIKCENKCEKM